jgi:hypothetical protein
MAASSSSSPYRGALALWGSLLPQGTRALLAASQSIKELPASHRFRYLLQFPEHYYPVLDPGAVAQSIVSRTPGTLGRRLAAYAGLALLSYTHTRTRSRLA